MLINANGWNLTGNRGVLSILNEVQNIFLRNESAQSQVFDTVDGGPPHFDVVDGQLEYEIDGVWRVSEVLIDNSEYADWNLADYGLEMSDNRPEHRRLVTYNHHDYIRVQNVSTRDRVWNTPATIVFMDNPGDHDDYYRYVGFEIPPQVTGLEVQLSIPEHLHMEFVVPACNKLIEAFQNNNWKEAILEIETFYKPKVIAEMNSGEQGLDYTVKRRGA